MGSSLDPNGRSEGLGRTSRRFTDFEQLAAFFSGWNGRIEQISCGRFVGDLTAFRGRVIRLVSLQANQSVIARGEQEDGLMAVYPVSPTNAGCVWRGRRLDPGRLVVHGSESHIDHLTARQFSSTGFSASVSAMRDAARQLSGGREVSLPRSWAAVSVSANTFRAIDRRLRRLLAPPTADQFRSGTAEGEQLEQDCIRAVLAGVLGNPSGHTTPALPARTQLVRDADELMRGHLRSPLGVIDLCSALTASERTLRLAFHERFGVGPMTYYRILRLNAVRAALTAGMAGEVAEAARGFGFTHLGNFAADYRRQFGERPSETKATARHA